jgi:tetratricopeptide (TPR) repeat protein
MKAINLLQATATATALTGALLNNAPLFAASENEAGQKPAPLFKDLGHHHHPITTQSKLAQRYFDQGLTLCYGFNHNEAIRSFEGAAKVDPDCAMAWWGVAYAYGPNINMPMLEPAVPKAWAALQKAVALRDKASPKEQAYIDALAKRYAENSPKDRAPLDQAYAEAMRQVAKQYPDDLDAQTLFAEALMDTSPWRYWQPDLTPKPNAAEAIALVESVLARVRKHPGAEHLYIHLMEAGPYPEKAERSADLLGKFAPGAGHLVHMPSHTYVRVGRYHDASTANEKASRADESYLAQCLQQGMYPGGYYPHNVHFLWFACDLEGRSEDAIKAARKVSAYTTELRCGAIEGPRQRYLHLLAWARFGHWDEILKDPEPGADYPFDRAMWHYARGLAFAAKGKPDEAAREYASFAELEKSEKVIAMDNPYFPGTKILAIGDEVLAGKIAGARGANDEMLAHLRKAVELQDAMPYMEPPYWYFSTRLALGAALLRAGKAAEAEGVFREDLKHFPENGWTLFGLEQSLQQQEKADEARKVHRQFNKAWKNADVPLELAWF